MTLEELKVVISAQIEPFEKQMEEMKKTLKSLERETAGVTNGIASKFKNLLKGIVALKIGQKIAQSIVGGLKDAMNVEAAIQQIKRIMGESSQQFLKWADTQAIAFNMSKSQAIRYGSIFGNLVRGFSKDATEAMTNTTELLKASSIIASATGRTMEDVMERIRSGLLGNTEAIEDLGVNVNVAMIESTDAFRKFANGKSWNQLSFQTQQQIRLMAILEQTTKNYGDSVSNNTSTQLAQLVANLNNVKLALGQAFLPIAQIILPLLNQLAQGLYYIMNLVSQFTQALFGKPAQAGSTSKTIKDQGKAVGGLGKQFEGAGKKAKKAGKEFKGALAGFDEINNISNKSPSGDSDGGGAGADIPTMAGVGPMPIDFTTNAPEISSVIQEMADKVKSVLATVFEPFKRSWEIYGKDVMLNVDIIFLGIKEIALRLGETLYNVWSNPATQESVVLLVGIFTDLFSILTRIFNEMIKPTVLNFLDLLDPTKNPAAQGFLDKIQEVLGGVKNLTEYLAGEGFKYVEDFLKLFMAFKAVQFVVEMAKATVALALNTKAWIANTVEMVKNTVLRAKDFIASLISSVINIYKNIAALVAEELAMSGATLAQYALNLAMSLNPITLVIAAVMGLVAAVVILYNKFEWFRNGVKWIVNGIIGGLNKLIDGLNKIKFELPSWVPGIGGKGFGINIPKIPMLAQGGYVGANSPMLAMIGDNKREGEIVAPESKIYDQTYRAITDALRQNGNGSNKPLQLTIQFGSTRVFKTIIDGINQANKEAGENLIII